MDPTSIAHPNRHRTYINEILRDMKMNKKPIKPHRLSTLGIVDCRAANNTPQFTLFPQLPSEIRLAIWEFAVLQPRTIIFRYHEAETPRKSGFIRCHLRRLFVKPKLLPTGRLEIRNAFPGVLCACTESHAVAMNQYSLAFDTVLNCPLWFNYSRDILSFENALLWWFEDCRNPQIKEAMRPVQNIVVKDNSRFWVMLCDLFEIMGSFKDPATLNVIVPKTLTLRYTALWKMELERHWEEYFRAPAARRGEPLARSLSISMTSDAQESEGPDFNP